MFKSTLLTFLLCIFISVQAQKANSRYVGVYSGVYTYDTCRIPMSLELKADGTYALDMRMINTNTGKNYHDNFYLIPHQSQGKWFVKKGFLFLSQKTNDTFCADGQTNFERNNIIVQNDKHYSRKFIRTCNKYSIQKVITTCGSEYFEFLEYYSCYEFTRLRNKKLALDTRIGADFYEQAWTGRGTYLVRK